jgi:hypothetical protein
MPVSDSVYFSGKRPFAAGPDIALISKIKKTPESTWPLGEKYMMQPIDFRARKSNSLLGHGAQTLRQEIRRSALSRFGKNRVFRQAGCLICKKVPTEFKTIHVS